MLIFESSLNTFYISVPHPSWNAYMMQEKGAILFQKEEQRSAGCGGRWGRQRGLEASLSQKRGKELRQKDADGEGGTPAKPQAEATPRDASGHGNSKGPKAGRWGRFRKEQGTLLRQWKDTYSTVQVLCQEGKSCSHHSWWVFCEEIRHLILIISLVLNCSALFHYFSFSRTFITVRVLASSDQSL